MPVPPITKSEGCWFYSSVWGGISVLLTLTRVYIIFAFQRRAPLTSDIDRWATLHVIGVTVSALMWAIPSISLWPAEYPVFQLVWPIFILPLSAAAVATYYTWTSSYDSFLVLTQQWYEHGFKKAGAF